MATKSYQKSAGFYDLIYSGKDYGTETARVCEIIKQYAPHAKTVLDVACGTGEHAKFLAKDFSITGIDLEPKFIPIAQSKVPSGKFSCADMVSFDLREKFDVVLCLFSAIGFVRTKDGLQRTIGRFKAHLKPGGIIIAEPWIEPSEYNPGYMIMKTYENAGTKICRMGVSGVKDGMSAMTEHFLVATPSGVEYFTEDLEMGLFTRPEMLQAFTDHGLKVDFDEKGLIGRGLYIAR
ncbi:MAG: class I SAM-dependent methyltransferase [Oligoflexales bacterium]